MAAQTRTSAAHVAISAIVAIGSLSTGHANGPESLMEADPVMEALSGVGNLHVQYDRQTAELYVRSYSGAGTVQTVLDAVKFARQEQRAAAAAFSGNPVGSVVCETNSSDWTFVLRVATTARALAETSEGTLEPWITRSVVEARDVDSSVWRVLRPEALGVESQAPN